MSAKRITFSVGLTLSCFFDPSMSTDGRRLMAQERVPASYVCTMDAEILDDKPGVCSICKMELQPARIETAWSCPIHGAIVQDKAGKCKFDHRDLVPVTINHFWVCVDNAKTQYAEAGRCANGQPRQERKLVRVHGDHNPRHGGQFFMAGDKTHHLEGTYPTAGVFRLYFFDNFTKAIDPKEITGRVFTVETGGREVDPVGLEPSQDGTTLEARIEGRALPQRVTAMVRFKSATPEERFDFTFAETTREVLVRAWPGTVESRPAPSSPRPNHLGPPWPGDISSALTVIDIRTREIRTLIDAGNFAIVYAPTMLAKEMALAVADHVTELPTERGNAMVLAVKRVVLAAWSIDRFGDSGDRVRLVEGYEEFALAVSEMKLAYGTR